ncbi:MAG: beta-N-acetylhexosaminidase [Leptospiraceae bacterium]|nr:beta-N-acetylhexosaminidase [Leptospiraceae bacterium]
MYQDKIRKISLALAFVALALSGCVDADAEAEESLQKLTDRIVKSMTLEEKVGQLIHIGISGKTMRSGIDSEIGRFRPGGVILFGVNLGSAQEVKDLNRKLQESSLKHTGIPLLISIDQEGGRVVRLTHITQFPGAMSMGQTGEPDLARAVGFVTAKELRDFGFNLVLAPVLDINNNPKNPVINTRSYGSNTSTVTSMGLAYMEGVQTAGSIPVIKHFPGHGDTTVDSHHDLPTISRTLEELRKTELVPFKAAIEKNAPALMTAHILFPALDPEYPATLSSAILQNLLRKELHFKGLIFTDAMEMKAIADRYETGRSAVLAIKAGVDVLLLTAEGPTTRRMFEAIIEAVQKGEISQQRIDESVKRQVYWKLRTGVFKRYASSRYSFVQQDKELQKYWKEQSEAEKQQLLQIQKDYDSRLNETVSRKGIVSLRKQFEGLKAKPEQTFFFYRTAAAKKQAEELGIPQDRMIFYRTGHTWLFRIYEKQWSGAWIIEIEETDLPLWNLLSSRWKSRRAEPLIGLYAGNPFHNISIPENGAVLCSFSPTFESRQALVYRAFQGPVKKADLILPEAR